MQSRNRNRAGVALILTLLVTVSVHSFAQAIESIPFLTYIGGELDEAAGDVALAPNGDRVFCSSSQSQGLATPGAVQAAPAGQYDVIVGRYSATGDTLQFLTYFGGTRLDICNRIAVDSVGDIIFTGYTTSEDFPTVNAADDTFAGGGFRDQDGFVVKLSGATGAVVFSTYLGGLDANFQNGGGFPGDETIRGLVIDSADRILVAGDTAAADFPATNVLGDGGCGDDPTPISVGATGDQFVARFLPDGAMDFATCISASEIEYGRDVAVSEDGLIYLAGSTVSPDYPTTQPDIGPGTPGAGSFDGVVTVLNASGSQILRAVRVGSSTEDFVQNIELGSVGQVIVQAQTDGQDFPTTAGAWQTEPGLDTFVAREWDNAVFGLTSDLDALLFSTYVGGEGDDLAYSLALDDDRPVLHMDTDSRGLATIAPVQGQIAGQLDVFAPFDSNTASTFSRGNEVNVSVGGLDLFAVAGAGLNRLWLLNPNTSQFEVWRELEEGENDTRTILFDDINGDNNPDIVTGNYEGQNFVYFGDFFGNYGPPIPFGDPATRTTALAVAAGGNGTCVVEFVEDGINIQHTYFAGSFDGGQPLGSTATASRDAGAARNKILEISAPDQITLYDGCGDGPVMQAVDVATFPGSDFVDADVWAYDEGGLDDAAFADRNGGVLVIRDFEDAPLGEAITQTDGPPTNAVLIRELGGLISAHDDVYRYYDIDRETLELVLESEVPTSTPGTDLLRSFSTGSVYATTQAGLEQAVIGNADVYLVRLAADGSDADFATYLGGGGGDFATAGLVKAGPGRLLISAITASQTFPGTDDNTPFPNSGRRDVVLFELEIASDTLDTDGDEVIDAEDNCTLASNADQIDSNGDGFGNACDQDIDNNGIVNFADLGLFRAAFFGNPGSANWNPDADFNGDGNVGFIDLGLLRAAFFGPPGPAGTIE